MTINFTSLEDRNWDLIVRSILYRLNVILSERFGCRALYRSKAQLLFEAPEIVERLSKAFNDVTVTNIKIQEELIIPVRLAQTVAGYVIVVNGSIVEPAKLEDALNLIDHALIESITIAERLNSLINEERESAVRSSENVIPFRYRDTWSATNPLEWKTKPSDGFLLWPRPILLVGQSREQVQCLALAFHEQLENSAMVPLKDLDPRILQEVALWPELGRTTVLIPDVTTLTTEELLDIQRVSIRYSQTTHPLIIGGLVAKQGSTCQVSDLIDKTFRMRFQCPDSSLGSAKIGDIVRQYLLSTPLHAWQNSQTSH